MGTNVGEQFIVDFYKFQDDEVKAFLRDKYVGSGSDENYWNTRYSYWSGFTTSGAKHTMDKTYLQGLVRRRFGFRLSTSNRGGIDNEFYNPNSNLVLARSGEESLMPRNWREFKDLFLFIATETDYAIKEELVETYVKPLVVNWADNLAFNSIYERRTEDDGNVSTERTAEVVRLTSRWAKSSASTERMIENIERLSDQLVAGVAGSDINDKWPSGYFESSTILTIPDTQVKLIFTPFWIELVSGYNDAFKENPTVQALANPAEALGFINELIDAGFDKDATSKDLEDAIRDDNSEFNGALNKLRDRITDSETQRSLKDEDDILNMRQCFLMSQKNFALPGGALAPEWANDNINLTDWFAGKGEKRIYRTQESKYLLNRLIGSPAYKGEWYTDCHTKLTMNKKLYWVFTDSTGELRQEELFLTQDRLVEDYWDNAFGSEFQQETKNLNENQKKKAALEEQKKFGAWNSVENLRKGHYYLKGVNIIYEGTNPSTARKDVQVEMEFQISSLASLELPISNKIILDQETGEGYHVKLFNLITLPVTNKIGTRKGLGTVNVAAYDPDYSRVRLVVYENELDTSSLSIDLSTIDHSISRDSSTGTCTLKINYRGYFEQVLTMPFTDVLADKRKRDKRRAIDAQMEIIKNGNECSAKALRKAKQIEFDFYKSNTANIKSSRFIQELYNRGLIYEYEFAADPLITSWNLNANPDPSKIIRNFSKSNMNGSLKGPLFDENGQLIDNVTDEIYKEYVNKRGSGRKNEWWEFNSWWNNKEYQGEEVYKGSCFFLGDLFNLALDTIYEDEETRKKLKLQFLFGSIDTTNALSNKNETQNPLDFAVDVVVFMKWFEQRVVAKKIAFYPLTTFFRDMLQTLLVDLKTRFCAIDNEEPPMYRMAFINTTTMYDLDPFNDDVDMDNPFGFGPMTGPIFERSPIQTEEKTRNYCVFYQQTESRFQTVKYNDRKHTPRIFYGIKNNRFNSVSDVSFSKTDAPHLREARYFNNNFGDLSLLSNVYNLSFSFKNMCANKDFYPGTIFEFVLLDWGPEWVDSHPVKKVRIERNNETGEYEAGDYRVFGEANPHRFGTIANVTGFGGYYIATKVDYVLGETNRDFEIKVEAKFIGANESLLMRKGEMDKNVGQPDSTKTEEQCLEELRKIAGVPKKKDDDKAANVATPGG